MNKIIGWFADNTVAANLLMILMVTGGIFTMFSIRKEIVPQVDTNLIVVTVPYPGATPQEVQDSICVRMEEELEGISGVKRMTSTAAENAGTVRLELLSGTDSIVVLNTVKNLVDSIDNFPEEAERPVVQEIEAIKQVISVAVSGNVDERSLKVIAEHVRDEISSLEGITKTKLTNVRPYEISIEVSEAKLRMYGLTFSEVANAVRRSSSDLPGGSIKTKGGEILLRTLGQSYLGLEFEEIVLRTNSDGARVRLADVADVVDGFAETDNRARFDGKRAALVQVFRVGNQSVFEISDAVHAYVDEAKDRMPAGVSLTVWRDDTEILESRLELLLRNGWQGFILVFILLALFLRLELAIWVVLGIPISFLGALWVLPSPYVDVTINLISLFGFIVVLGIVVDDTIVIGENVYTHMRKGVPSLEAAKRGTIEMAKPVIFAILTTIAAFSVMLGIGGIMGQFASAIPLVVIPCLCFSLVEALLILPAHLRYVRVNKQQRGLARIWTRFQSKFSGGLENFVLRQFRPFLDLCLRWRYTSLATGAVMFLVSISVVLGGRLEFVFFPSIDSDVVNAVVTMPIGTPIEVTQAAVDKLERSARKACSEVDDGGNVGDPKLLRFLMASTGSQPFFTEQQQNSGLLVGLQSASHLGEVTLQILSSDEREISSKALANRWRELTGSIEDSVELKFISNLITSGQPINVQLSAPDPSSLQTAANRLKEKLAAFDGTFDISDSFRAGKDEVRLSIKAQGEALGLRLADLARQVRQAYFGEEAQRIQRDRDDVRVMVRYTKPERRSLASLEDMRIRTAQGDEVPLSTVAELHFERGVATIQRADRKRSVTVTADVNTAVGNANAINKELSSEFLPALKKEVPGLSYSFEGGRREQEEFMTAMASQARILLVVIFALLAIPLASYLQPLIIMSVIPFGIIGAIWGHVLMGINLTMMSMIGLIAVVGIVVNDSLVLVDCVNRRRKEHDKILDSVREAVALRFRPILLTSLTTVAGLFPLLREKSMQAQFLIPAAVSLAFGVMFATVITLILVPCLYLVLEDLKGLAARLKGATKAV